MFYVTDSEYVVQIHPGASPLIRSDRMLEALEMARTTARFMGRSAYVYSPHTHRFYEVNP